MDPVERLRQTARNLLNAIDSEEAASWALGSDVTDELRAALDAFERATPIKVHGPEYGERDGGLIF